MKKAFSLLQKIVLKKDKSAEEEQSVFDKRLKKVNRARVVNQVGLGGPVFKSRASETEA
jgi:hypothetical protein